MANNELYQVTLTSSFQGQTFNNVFYYLQQSAAPTDDTAALDLANQFVLDVIDDAAFLTSAVFHTSCVWSNVRVINVYDDLDFADVPLTGFTGASSITPLPPYAAISFRTSWLGPAIHRGQKRFGGITEDVNTNGTVTSTFLTLCANFANVLGNTITDNTGLWNPVVVKRTKYITSEGTEAYRLPLNEADAFGKIFPAQTWSLNTNLSTQNTRKFGRGV